MKSFTPIWEGISGGMFDEPACGSPAGINAMELDLKLSRKLKKRLMKGTAGTFFLKIAGAGLSFLMGILIARLMGASNYGAYCYALAWAGVMTRPSTVGMQKLLVRQIASYHVQGAWGLMRGILRRANQAGFTTAVVLGLAVMACVILIKGGQQNPVSYSLALAGLVIPVMVLNKIRQAALQGLHHVTAALFPEMLIRPALLIALFVIVYVVTGEKVGAPTAMGLNISVGLVTLVIGVAMLRNAMPPDVRTAQPEYAGKAWLYSALPLLWLNIAQVINTRNSILMLGALRDASEVGLYSVASRAADSIGFILSSANMTLGPAIAGLHALGDKKQLQHMMIKSSNMILAASLPIALALIFFGRWFLMLYGTDFVHAHKTLIILSIGELVNAATGSVGLLMVMTGHERHAAVSFTASAVLGLALNALLIPPWGMAGAACSRAVCLILWNISMAVMVYKRLGIYSTALAGARLPKDELDSTLPDPPEEA